MHGKPPKVMITKPTISVLTFRSYQQPVIWSAPLFFSQKTSNVLDWSQNVAAFLFQNLSSHWRELWILIFAINMKDWFGTEQNKTGWRDLTRLVEADADFGKMFLLLCVTNYAGETVEVDNWLSIQYSVILAQPPCQTTMKINQLG